MRDELSTKHPEINLIDFDLYDVGIFNECEQSGDLLVAIQGWSIVHPMMKVIRADWAFEMPIGILYPPEPSETVSRFLAAAREVLEQTE